MLESAACASEIHFSVAICQRCGVVAFHKVKKKHPKSAFRYDFVSHSE